MRDKIGSKSTWIVCHHASDGHPFESISIFVVGIQYPNINLQWTVRKVFHYQWLLPECHAVVNARKAYDYSMLWRIERQQQCLTISTEQSITSRWDKTQVWRADWRFSSPFYKDPHRALRSSRASHVLDDFTGHDHFESTPTDGQERKEA